MATGDRLLNEKFIDVALPDLTPFCREFGSFVDPDLAPVNPAMPIPLLSLSRRAGKSMQL
jgi:hypothetical protein